MIYRFQNGKVIKFQRGGWFRNLFKKKSTPEIPDIDYDYIDNQIEEENKRLDYEMRRNEAKAKYDSMTPADRYYNRMELYDQNAKKFLSNMYQQRKSMFPEIDINAINEKLKMPYLYYDGVGGEGGYFNKHQGINYAYPNYITTNTYMGDVPVHERTHSLQMTDQEKAIQNEIDRSYADYNDNGKPYYGFLREGVEYDPYLDDPSEIYARRNAFLQYLSEHGVDYSGETKDERTINDFTPNLAEPIGGRWIEALKSNGNAKNIESFSHSPEMYEDEYWNEKESMKRNNNFLERYSPEFIQFLLNGIAQNNRNNNMPQNTQMAKLGKKLIK